MRMSACITGATSGIGAAYATLLARRGYDLILTGRREAVLTERAASLRDEYGVSVDCVIGDLAETAVLQELTSRVRERADLALLIHNAGFGHRTPFFETDDSGVAAMARVHMDAAVALTRAAIPTLRTTAAGGPGDDLPPAVILVSSLAAFTPLPAAAMYTATKGFLVQFGRAIAPDLAGAGVAVQVLCPGFTHTDFHDRLGWTSERRRSRGLVRWMSAEEVARRSLQRLARRGAAAPVVYVPGWTNRLLRRLVALTPERAYRALASRIPG